MDLRSANPYFLLKNGLINHYPSLDKDLKTDVVIMGSGISGALTAWYLARKGLQTVIVDRRHAAMGSTIASTSLLQYEIDTPLHELIGLVGEKNAVRSYAICIEAIDTLEKICNKLKADVDFKLNQSLQYASFRNDVSALRTEYEVRKKNDIKVTWLDETDMDRRAGFSAPAGLLSAKGAQVDAFRLTHALLKEAPGLSVFDSTHITEISHRRNGVTVKSEQGYSIRAKRLVIACGYESRRYLPEPIDKLSATYACVSEPIAEKELWLNNCLLWETATPYLYMRRTEDKRVLMGGLDDDFYDPARRDGRLAAKVKRLKEKFAKLFPQAEFKVDFQWAGTFSSTKDGLPYIGTIRQRPNTFFALGYGGNGIVFSVAAAQIITDLICGKSNKDADIFSFKR